MMFSPADRERLRDRVLQWANSDARVVAGAVVGSLALGAGDRWADLDLTFGVADEVPLGQLLDDWTERLIAEFDALHLFDLPSGPSIYRVFMLPGCLQFDLSFTPASQFGATSPRFTTLSTLSKPPCNGSLDGHGTSFTSSLVTSAPTGRLSFATTTE